jgi:hypothetical protein
MKVLGLENVAPLSGEVTPEPSYGGILGAAFDPARQAEREFAEYLEQHANVIPFPGSRVRQ